MRAVGKVALVLSLLCVVVSAYSLATPMKAGFCWSDPCPPLVNCGSAAFAGDVDRPDFGNCSSSASGAGAQGALIGMGLAGLGLVVVAATSWRSPPRRTRGRAPNEKSGGLPAATA